LYSATKIANEAIAHSYSHLFSLPTTGLRFFTVYGPAGRPDMAPFIFVRKALRGETISLFNQGQGTRDFTYIDDIVNAIVALISLPATADKLFSRESPNPSTSTAPFRIFNIGSGQPVRVTDFLTVLEAALGVSVPTKDMDVTHADTSALRSAIGWTPKTSLAAGVDHLVRWCRSNPSLLGD
jgi:UDP-glucuronate 4-epimerase